jgi:hypothetical protein
VSFRNRVTPNGEIVALDLRCAWTGNRGRLHQGREIVRFHNGKLWITCALEFNGRHNEQWQPNHYTFLFFFDEAVAFAAGHRPCGECRHQSYKRYQRDWATTHGTPLPSAPEMDRVLHTERVFPNSHRRRRYTAKWVDLPDGTFVDIDGRPAVVVNERISFWGDSGYTEQSARPRTGHAEVITPRSTVAILAAGYPIQIDDSALETTRERRGPA